MSGIYWLASYPKSGNTWVRALLTNYIRDGNEPAPINALCGGPIASARLWFDEWVGVEASSLDQATIDRLRPEVYRRLAASSPETRFMKVHDAWTPTDAGEPMFPADVTHGVIYIVRNPLDVAPSLAHHFGETIEDAVQRMCDPQHSTHSSSSTNGGLDDQLRQRLGSWSDHVRSWTEESGLAVHVVRYEDLFADGRKAFADVLRFADLADDTSRVDKAVAFSSFARLQGQEHESGFRERPPRAKGNFFRKGEVGSWKTELSADQARRLADACHDTMARFSYGL